MSRLPGLAALLALSGPVLACGDEEVCGSLARLCADPGRWRILATDVQDGVVLDFDGDGEDEGVALSRSGWKLALGHTGGQFDGWRWMLHFDAEPVGLEALSGELAVAFTEPPLVAIFGVDGGGRLERRRDIALSSSPAALRSHDLDGDGAPELFATLPATGRLAVVDPTSGEVREYAAGSQPSELAVGDVDGDARSDVVVVDAPARALAVLRGAGDRTLTRPTQSLSSATVLWLELADHDGDGDTQDGPTIYRHLDGEPDRRAALVTDEEAFLLRAADVDGDGRYDLAVAGEEKVSVWLRGEDGPRRVQLLEAPIAIVAVDFPDVDGDDRPDFVALAASGDMFVRCTQAAAPPRPETMP